MKKVALLVLALVAISLSFSSCSKDKACKCTYKIDGKDRAGIICPENYDVETCSKLQEQLKIELESATVECKKF